MMLKTDLWFPNVEESTEEGIVAVGGDLSVERLILAYSKGIFPWYSSDNSPILWWSPDPRFVLLPESLIVSKACDLILIKINSRLPGIKILKTLLKIVKK